MNKNFNIVNNNNLNYCIDYFLYILLFIFIMYFIYNSVASNKESFQTNSEQQQVTQELQSDNLLLKQDKLILQETLDKYKRDLYLINNYKKVDDDSFNDINEYINDYTYNTIYPSTNLKNKKIIENQNDLDKVLEEAKTFKNIYKTGEIVTLNSSFNINKNKICYNDYEQNILNNPDFTKKYPECMVCSINPDDSYKKTKSWKNTKTNIHKVCLYNPTAEPNSDVLDYNGCKKLCS